MIGIIDYGMGNLHSVANACAHLGFDYCISSDQDTLAACDKLILPGVGAMKDCMENLHANGLYDFIEDQVTNQKKPILGICLGMQAFFEASEENGGVDCFGFIKGKVVKMDDPDICIPHIGWNSITIRPDHPLHDRLPEKVWVYFDHSYYGSGMDEKELVAASQHGRHVIPGIVARENILGCQFHPEKSAQQGLAILDYFGREFA